MLGTIARWFNPPRVHNHDESLNLRELVFGYNDGLVTTFTVVVGFTGASLAHPIIVIAALINAISDGLSMAFGAWLSTKSEREQYEATVRDERAQIESDPNYERDALREHLEGYGLPKRSIESAMKQITSDKDRWAHIITRDVRGLEPNPSHSPLRDSTAMFLAFLVGSLFPIIPFLFGMPNPFLVSVALSVVSAFGVGAYKTVVTKRSWISSGLETLGIAVLLMSIAYGLGVVISAIVPV